MNPEVIKLAQKLHEQGIARTRMDAIKMAESMLSVDLNKPSKTRISNVPYPENEKPIELKEKNDSIPINIPINIDADIDTNATLKDMLQMESEIKQEIKDFENTDSNESEIIEKEIEEFSNEDTTEKPEIQEETSEKITHIEESEEQTKTENNYNPEKISIEKAETEIEPETLEKTSSFEEGIKEFQDSEDVPERSQIIPVDKSKPKGELSEEEKAQTDITKLFKF
jgi:hypothetical protein